MNEIEELKGREGMHADRERGLVEEAGVLRGQVSTPSPESKTLNLQPSIGWGTVQGARWCLGERWWCCECILSRGLWAGPLKSKKNLSQNTKACEGSPVSHRVAEGTTPNPEP